MFCLFRSQSTSTATKFEKNASLKYLVWTWLLVIRRKFSTCGHPNLDSFSRRAFFWHYCFCLCWQAISTFSPNRIHTIVKLSRIWVLAQPGKRNICPLLESPTRDSRMSRPLDLEATECSNGKNKNSYTHLCLYSLTKYVLSFYERLSMGSYGWSKISSKSGKINTQLIKTQIHLLVCL